MSGGEGAPLQGRGGSDDSTARRGWRGGQSLGKVWHFTRSGSLLICLNTACEFALNSRATDNGLDSSYMPT